MNAGLIQGIGGFAVTQPAYKPKNDGPIPTASQAWITAKATQDVNSEGRCGCTRCSASRISAR